MESLQSSILLVSPSFCHFCGTELRKPRSKLCLQQPRNGGQNGFPGCQTCQTPQTRSLSNDKPSFCHFCGTELRKPRSKLCLQQPRNGGQNGFPGCQTCQTPQTRSLSNDKTTYAGCGVPQSELLRYTLLLPLPLGHTAIFLSREPEVENLSFENLAGEL